MVHNKDRHRNEDKDSTQVNKKLSWEVHVEWDQGGRVNTDLGITQGVPYLLSLFKAYQIQATWYVCTELIRDYARYLRMMLDHGHTLGTHGHFHIPYRDSFRKEQDVELSQAVLKSFTGTDKNPCLSRKLDCRGCHLCPGNDGIPRRGLLRCLWTGQRPRPGETVYIHPYDVVDHKFIGCSLFTTLYYCRPKEARRLLESLLNQPTI